MNLKEGGSKKGRVSEPERPLPGWQKQKTSQATLDGYPIIPNSSPPQGERPGEGEEVQPLAPSPRPSSLKEREFSDSLPDGTLVSKDVPKIVTC